MDDQFVDELVRAQCFRHRPGSRLIHARASQRGRCSQCRSLHLHCRRSARPKAGRRTQIVGSPRAVPGGGCPRTLGENDGEASPRSAGRPWPPGDAGRTRSVSSRPNARLLELSHELDAQVEPALTIRPDTDPGRHGRLGCVDSGPRGDHLERTVEARGRPDGKELLATGLARFWLVQGS
jgi:hypothetical protein